jgi:hypothetical protein
VTAIDDRIAPMAPLHRAPRRAARTAPVSTDLHARLVAEVNRLLDATDTTEKTSAYDALAYFAGALIGAMPPGGRPLSKHALVDLVERTANRLGCPPAVAPVARRRSGGRS